VSSDVIGWTRKPGQQVLTFQHSWEGFSQTTNHLSEKWCSTWNSNQKHPKYSSEALPMKPARWVPHSAYWKLFKMHYCVIHIVFVIGFFVHWSIFSNTKTRNAYDTTYLCTLHMLVIKLGDISCLRVEIIKGDVKRIKR
jgi:hypothetical protein